MGNKIITSVDIYLNLILKTIYHENKITITRYYFIIFS